MPLLIVTALWLALLLAGWLLVGRTLGRGAAAAPGVEADRRYGSGKGPDRRDTPSPRR